MGEVINRVTSTWLLPALLYECFGWYWVGQFSLSLYWLIKHHFSPCRDSISDAEGSLGCVNQCILHSQNPKCYNIVNDCSYRVVSVFRIPARDLGSVLKSNLAPTQIYMVRMLNINLYECICAVLFPQKPHP